MKKTMNVKKIISTTIIIVTMLFLCVIGVQAYEDPASGVTQSPNDMLEEQFKESGAGDLYDNLPNNLKTALAEFGIDDLDGKSFLKISPNDMIQSMYNISLKQLGAPLKTFALMLGVIILYAFVNSMGETFQNEETSKIFGTVCALVSSVLIISPLFETIREVSASAESISVFMLSFVPVYGVAMVSTGQIAGALSYQTIVLFVCELIALATTYFIIPIMTVSLTLGISGSMTPDYKLDKVGETINKFCTWIIALVSTLFTGMLSLQGIVTSATDSLSSRAVRFSLGSFVPIVGGAISESLQTIQGSLSVLKSTIGVFGIIVILVIIIPILFKCILWAVCLSLCGMVAEMFELSILVTLFRTIGSVMKTLIAVLVCCGLFMIIATTIMTKAVV